MLEGGAEGGVEGGGWGAGDEDGGGGVGGHGGFRELGGPRRWAMVTGLGVVLAWLVDELGWGGRLSVVERTMSARPDAAPMISDPLVSNFQFCSVTYSCFAFLIHHQKDSTCP